MAKPLLGKRIVVTRAQEQSAEMATQLEQLGAIVIRCPLIAFDPLPTATAQLDAALQQSFDWLLFTSQNGVRFFFESFVENKAPPPNLPQRGRDLIPLPSGGARGGFPKIGASGPKTAAKLAEYGVIADLIPDQFVGERLVEALGDVAGKRILLPRAKQGRPKIVAMLRERGARVTEIALYDTVCPAPDFETRQAIEAGVDVVTFASPSAVKGFVQSNFRLSTAPLFACIGPVTAISAENHTLPVHIMPEKYTIDALITAIVEQYQPSNLLRSSRLGGEPSLSYV